MACAKAPLALAVFMQVVVSTGVTSSLVLLPGADRHDYRVSAG